jgi:HlyD family secretion protein
MLIVVLALIVLAGGAGGWYWHSSSKAPIDYRTAKIRRGELLATIGATGTIEPEATVDVGAQVIGPITMFGMDSGGKPIDYRSPVEAGMLLAKIDDATYKADRDTAEALLKQADAALLKAHADVKQNEALFEQAEANWIRAQKIGQSDALSKNDYEMYKATYATTGANVEVAKSEVSQAEAGITQAKAALDKAQRNLDFCTIKSPVKGVIIDRRVNIGQTVVGSLTPASMFLIGEDLSKMQILVAVNEADIGHIFPGQHVTFTCDAFQGSSFVGKVNRVRLFATMTQNVVTYTVEVKFDNADGKLIPYLTANVQFELEKEANVLLVPNSALRWYPGDKAEVVEDARAKWKPVDSEEREKPTVGEMPTPTKKDKNGKSLPNKKPDRFGTLWLKEGQFVRPVKVKIGSSDGADTEVSAESLNEGGEVVVGEILAAAQDSQEHNAFLPQMKHH